MDDTTTTGGGTAPIVGPLPPAPPPGVDSAITESTAPHHTTPVAPISGGARSTTTPSGSSSSSTTGKTAGTDPAQSMSQMGTGARDTSDSKLIDDSTKLFPGTTMAGEGEGNVGFRNERSASTSSTSSSVTGSDRLMGSASTVTELPPHPRRGSHGQHFLFEGLIEQKRRNDPASVARRQSLSEQRQTESHGFIAKMWDNWVRGAPPDI